jgi:hypothetical protein
MSGSDSEYTESPIKAKKRGVRGKRSSVRKKKHEWSDGSEEEYVDETGGIYALIEEPSPASTPTVITPSKRAKSEFQEQPSFYSVAFGQDGYVDQDGTQMIEPEHQFQHGGSGYNVSTGNTDAHAVNFMGYGAGLTSFGISAIDYGTV